MTEPTPPGAEDRSAVLARAATQVEREDAEARIALARPVRRRAWMVAGMWVLLVANAVLWIVFPPSGPDGSDQRAPAAVERDLRLSVAGAAGDVENWRQHNGGQLPRTLDAAGLSGTGFAYTVVDSATFVLDGEDGGVRVSYRSTTPIAEFLVPRPGARP